MLLQTKLEDWVRSGIITAEQAKLIGVHEGSESSRSWATYSIAGIGIVVLLTGIVSILASNWEEISTVQKLGGYFFVQCLLGAGVVSTFSRPGLSREVCITLFALFFFAGIALVSQIYNLQGDSYAATAFWLVLTLPVTLLSRSRLISHLWMLTLAATVGMWAAAGSSVDGNYIARAFSTLTVGFAVAALGLLRLPLFPANFKSAARFWSLTYLTLVISLGVCVVSYDSPTIREYAMGRVQAEMWAAALVAALSVIVSGKQYVSSLRNSLVVFIASLAGAVTLTYEQFVPTVPLSGFILFEVIWALAAVCAALAHRRRLFDFISIVITLRFVVVYFELFGTLAATGFGLIVSGLVILAAAFGWNRYRKGIATWLEEKA